MNSAPPGARTRAISAAGTELERPVAQEDHVHQILGIRQRPLAGEAVDRRQPIELAPLEFAADAIARRRRRFRAREPSSGRNGPAPPPAGCRGNQS